MIPKKSSGTKPSKNERISKKGVTWCNIYPWTKPWRSRKKNSMFPMFFVRKPWGSHDNYGEAMRFLLANHGEVLRNLKGGSMVSTKVVLGQCQLHCPSKGRACTKSCARKGGACRKGCAPKLHLKGCARKGCALTLCPLLIIIS